MFSIAVVRLWVKVLISQGRMGGAVRNYSTNTIMEKKQTEGRGWGGGVKDMEFSGVLEK